MPQFIPLVINTVIVTFLRVCLNIRGTVLYYSLINDLYYEQGLFGRL